jgi:hypothetical protein
MSRAHAAQLEIPYSLTGEDIKGYTSRDARVLGSWGPEVSRSPEWCASYPQQGLQSCCESSPEERELASGALAECKSCNPLPWYASAVYSRSFNLMFPVFTAHGRSPGTLAGLGTADGAF